MPSFPQTQCTSQQASDAPAAEGGPGKRVSPGNTAADPRCTDSPVDQWADASASPAPDATAVQDAAGSAAPATGAQPTGLTLDAPPPAARPRVLACTERVPPEHAGCATFYMIRSADGPVQPLGLPELAAGVDCGLLPQGPTLASLEQVRPCPCMMPLLGRCKLYHV